jgi:hypothetical protein
VTGASPLGDWGLLNMPRSRTVGKNTGRVSTQPAVHRLPLVLENICPPREGSRLLLHSH